MAPSGVGRHGFGRMIAAIASGCAVVLALAACGSSSSSSGGSGGGSSTARTLSWIKQNAPGIPASVVRQACKEGKATVYLQSLANVPEYVSGIEKDLPCLSVANYAAPGGVIASRFTTESQSKKYNADVIMNTSPVFLQKMISSHFIAQFTPPTAKLIPARFQRKGYWYSTTMTTLTVAWNSSAVSSDQAKQLQGIKTWGDVLKLTGLSGKVGVIDIAAGGSDELPWYYLQHRYGNSYLQNFKKALDPEVYPSIIPATARLASGGTPVIFAALDGVPGGYIAKGAPIQWVYPKPYLATPLAVAVSAHAPHPAAAKLIETWMLSKDGQEQMETDNYSDPVSASVPDRRPFASASWFTEAPTAQDYDANWLKIQNALPALTTEFHSVLGSAQS